jgi:transmembrane secretion effector
VNLSPAFNRLAWSNLAAQSAEQVGLAAAPIVAVLTLGAGAGATGLLAQTLPFLLFAIPAGVLADRTSRRRLLTASEALRVLSLVGILALVQLGLLTLPLLALLGFVGACGTVAYSVTAPALVPALVLGPLAGLAAAVVMLMTIWAPSALLASLSFFLVGVGPIVWVISTATLRQTVTPRALLGRVCAISITAYGARPVGALIGAVVGGVYGAETCLVVAALGFLAQAVVIVTSPVLRLQRQPEMVG